MTNNNIYQLLADCVQKTSLYDVTGRDETLESYKLKLLANIADELEYLDDDFIKNRWLYDCGATTFQVAAM